ncbi:phage major capsid protein, P2 family [Hafnia sp.]|uniref:phage major capsid protein, P2 family n=1 Tax=Hafnia sp. TaxID=1873498 RepID=UPI002FC7CFF7
MRLTPRAEFLIRKYAAGLAGGGTSAQSGNYFSLTEPREIRLRNALMQSSEFLKLINIMDVDQIQGQVISTGNPGLFTGRVKGGRFSREMGNSGNEYKLVETDSGSFITYALLCVWANSGTENEFFQRIQAFSNKSFALDMLTIGFNGEGAAETTNPTDNPLGQDVNIGWHAIVKKRTPGQVVTGEVILGDAANADFFGLDAAATDLIHNCILEQYRNHPDLVVLAAADLIGADATTMMNKVDRPSEKAAARLITREIAGRKAYSPPNLPAGRLIVTTLSNLHIYTERGSRRRKAEWVDDRKQFENNYLRMEGYAVEHDELYAAFDKISLPTG